MVHDFNLKESVKTVSLHFMEDGKSRRIIFTKGTDAYIDISRLFNGNVQGKYFDDNDCIMIVKRMRERGYKFIANKNNKSIFRPVK